VTSSWRRRTNRWSFARLVPLAGDFCSREAAVFGLYVGCDGLRICGRATRHPAAAAGHVLAEMLPCRVSCRCVCALGQAAKAIATQHRRSAWHLWTNHACGICATIHARSLTVAQLQTAESPKAAEADR